MRGSHDGLACRRLVVQRPCFARTATIRDRSCPVFCSRNKHQLAQHSPTNLDKVLTRSAIERQRMSGLAVTRWLLAESRKYSTAVRDSQLHLASFAASSLAERRIQNTSKSTILGSESTPKTANKTGKSADAVFDPHILFLPVSIQCCIICMRALVNVSFFG